MLMPKDRETVYSQDDSKMKRVSISMSEEQVKWLDRMIDNDIFASYSHGVRSVLEFYRRANMLK